ncbi:MAG TPA: type-F conjugative transfer system pilin assembly protein TraF [Gammaproteobacteria bacterium]|jgi:conjugal transfer pilus assembly protein TraF|nr:type-F conjugative transfer system pilin assembly protein TraF [Gammaproteobacteria bacterium]
MGNSLLLLKRVVYIGCLVLFVFTKALASEVENYNDHAKGWYWHGILADEKKEEHEKEEIVNDPTLQMNAVRATVERALNKAILFPTKENVKDYITLQNLLAQNAEKFEKNWKAVLLNHAELDYSLTHPTNNIAKQIEYNQETLKENAVIQELAKTSGLFFFYRSSCPYCVRFAPIVKDFAETYGISIVPITTDGVALPEFPDSLKDRGQAAKFQVTMEPALFAVNPYTQKAFPVAYGLISAADLRKRLLAIATQYGGHVQ